MQAVGAPERRRRDGGRCDTELVRERDDDAVASVARYRIPSLVATATATPWPGATRLFWLAGGWLRATKLLVIRARFMAYHRTAAPLHPRTAALRGPGVSYCPSPPPPPPTATHRHRTGGRALCAPDRLAGAETAPTEVRARASRAVPRASLVAGWSVWLARPINSPSERALLRTAAGQGRPRTVPRHRHRHRTGGTHPAPDRAGARGGDRAEGSDGRSISCRPSRPAGRCDSWDRSIRYPNARYSAPPRRRTARTGRRVLSVVTATAPMARTLPAPER